MLLSSTICCYFEDFPAVDGGGKRERLIVSSQLEFLFGGFAILLSSSHRDRGGWDTAGRHATNNTNSHHCTVCVIYHPTEAPDLAVCMQELRKGCKHAIRNWRLNGWTLSKKLLLWPPLKFKVDMFENKKFENRLTGAQDTLIYFEF